MKKIYWLLFLVSLSAQAAIIWPSGTSLHSLFPNLDLNGVGGIVTGSVDPSSVATAGAPGTLYERSDGTLYVKQDSGSSTDWLLLSSGGSGASTALDNLASTAVNADINPGAPAVINLGSVSKYYRWIFSNGIRLQGGGAFVQSEGGGLELNTTVTDEPLDIFTLSGPITIDSELGGGGSTGNKIYTHGDIYMGLTTGATPTWHLKLLAPPVDPSDAATKASSESYSPGDPANWAGTPPATIKEALDRIAAVVSTNGAVPIP